MQMKHVASELSKLLAVKLRLDGFHSSAVTPRKNFDASHDLYASQNVIA